MLKRGNPVSTENSCKAVDKSTWVKAFCFLLVEGPYHEQTIKLNVFTQVKNRFGAQLDLPRFDNQKKRRERSPLSHSAEAVILDSII